MPTNLPTEVAISVVFAKDAQAAALSLAERPAVAVVPHRDSWNDYGLNFFAHLVILDERLDQTPIQMRLMFEGVPRTEMYFTELFGKHGPVIPVELVEKNFCSVLIEIESYSNVVERLGFDFGVGALRKLGDAVVTRAEAKDEARLSLINSDAFHVGALRSGDAYAAFRRGARYLRPSPVEAIDDAAQFFSMSAHLPSAQNPYWIEFDLQPDELFTDRVNVLIGRNGVGKTQLLRCIIDGLTDLEAQPETDRNITFLPIPKVSRVLLFSSVASDPYPRIIPPWFGIDYEYFSMTAHRESGVDALLGALVACRRDEYGSLKVLESIIEPLGIWESIYLPLTPPPQSGEDYFVGAETWEGGAYFPLATPLNERRKIALVQRIDWTKNVMVLVDGRQLRMLSSGELAMFRFAAQAVSAIERGSLLLFDEPETHLHPNFISNFMDILQRLLSETNSVAIVATHSAYVVREVPRHRVRILSIDDGSIAIDQPRLQTFGASIDTISQFVFGDTNLSHRYQQSLREWVEAHGQEGGLETILSTVGERLNPETLSFIAEILRESSEADGSA